jgi:hypothetical protein
MTFWSFGIFRQAFSISRFASSSNWKFLACIALQRCFFRHNKPPVAFFFFNPAVLFTSAVIVLSFAYGRLQCV